ncbi:MAG: hypothetical protein ABI690_27360 [Chloroflexota bacterium]
MALSRKKKTLKDRRKLGLERRMQRVILGRQREKIAGINSTFSNLQTPTTGHGTKDMPTRIIAVF